MAKEFIKYKSGYKYQLYKQYEVDVGIQPATDVVIDGFVELRRGEGVRGRLVIRKGYAWDGPSGPAIDTRNFLRGSLVHDALYQLMRKGKLDPRKWRKRADGELRRICLEDGMSTARAWWVYRGVRWGGRHAAESDSAKPVLKAP